jgi:hypothetical protein
MPIPVNQLKASRPSIPANSLHSTECSARLDSCHYFLSPSLAFMLARKFKPPIHANSNDLHLRTRCIAAAGGLAMLAGGPPQPGPGRAAPGTPGRWQHRRRRRRAAATALRRRQRRGAVGAAARHCAAAAAGAGRGGGRPAHPRRAVRYVGEDVCPSLSLPIHLPLGHRPKLPLAQLLVTE